MNISPKFKEILIIFSQPHSVQPVAYEEDKYKIKSLVSNKSYKISSKTYNEAMELVKEIQKKHDYITV